MVHARKHIIKENFFEKWTPDMAYILGFTATDGSVGKYTLSYHISEKDIEIIDFIRKQLGNVKIESKPKTNSIRVRYNSINLISSLKTYGIVPNKTSTLEICFPIPEEYVGDYVRGVFDGDGWICHRPGNRHGLSFGICSASELFITQIRSLCNDIGSIRCRHYTNDPVRKPQFYFENYTNQDAIQLRNIIYKNDNGFSLQRKKNIFFSRLNYGNLSILE